MTAISLVDHADRMAKGIRKHRRCITEDALRDLLDIGTAGDLDCTQLDILVDMVKSRLGETKVCAVCACYGD